MIELSQDAYFNQGTKITPCQKNQICQWITEIDTVFDKFEMIRQLREFDQIQDNYQIKSNLFIPETYLLNFDAVKNQSLTEDEQKFKELFDTQNIWYAKKSGFLYGKGEDLELIKETSLYFNKVFMKERYVETDSQGNLLRDKRIVQKAVEPLLINGKKPEFRNYLLILSVDPFVVLYRDGFLSLSLDQYKHELTGNEEQDRQNHLSTMYVQSTKKNFDEEALMKDPSQISMFMEQFLQHELKQGEQKPQLLRQFEKQVRDMYTYTALAIKQQLKSSNIGLPFQQYHLLGCDMLINQQYKPQLLECNAMPGTQGSDIYPSRVNSRDSVWESLDLIIKLHENTNGDYQKWKQELKNLKSNYDIGKYEILINEANNFNLLKTE